MTGQGWAEPLWLETTPDDTGERLARMAVASGVDLVISSGGDGTVTACAAGVAGSGIPLGVLPSGTGNLLARNLGLPLQADAALAVALTGAERRLDVGVANGRTFVVMAGIGFDAAMLASVSEKLKMRAGRGPRRCGAGPAAWSSGMSGRFSGTSDCCPTPCPMTASST